MVIFITMNLPWSDSKLLWEDSKLIGYFNHRKCRVKVTAVIYPAIFITLAPCDMISPKHGQT
jgi:hypothetical protein